MGTVKYPSNMVTRVGKILDGSLQKNMLLETKKNLSLIAEIPLLDVISDGIWYGKILSPNPAYLIRGYGISDGVLQQSNSVVISVTKTLSLFLFLKLRYHFHPQKLFHQPCTVVVWSGMHYQ